MLHKTRARNARPYGYDGTISSYFFRNIVGACIARPLFGICAKFRICPFTVYSFIVAQSFGNFKWGRTPSGDKLLQSRCARQTFGVPLACLPHSGRQAPRSQGGSPLGRFTISCKTARFAFKFPLSMLAPCYSTYITNFFNTSSNPLHDLPLRGTFSIVAACGGFRR